jgi:hypothetical protein
MTRNPLSSAQHHALVAEAEDKAREATEAVLNEAFNRLGEELDLWNYKSPLSEAMAKVVENTARKVLNRLFKVETRGRKRTYSMGYFRERFVLSRGDELAREGYGASKAAKIIHADLMEQFHAASKIMKLRGIRIERGKLPTVSAIKGRLERSRR